MDRTKVEPPPERLTRWERQIQSIGIAAGLMTILLPVFLFRRGSLRHKKEKTDSRFGVTSWSGMLFATLGYALFGIVAWRPLPLRLRARERKLFTGLGALFYFPGLGLYWWGQRTLGDLFRPSSSRQAELYVDHRLVEVGPYAFVRHPMYLGVFLTAGGALLIYRTWTMVFYTMSALAIFLRVRREEAALAAKFGQKWEAYRARVPAWLPGRHVGRSAG